ncbi:MULTISPECIES: fatty-acid--CoA ligase FadD1 [Gordonia]|uniref:fatty-acid--CoA ligase FadD1 n=1 Tax=Gordonia TaxID=2053 RepID=UPI00071CF730|nr:MULTISPECIES: fatty-acid--CoA ligase FadD1 [Gordonia]KSU57324.1 acyl-CoA synthetase [Gordonia sp. SGD-V-85]MCT1353518.1 fatty-acid--CoA ligase FadD1 [Gordonia sp. p3-SID1431]MCX2754705.1 fatty-acid--CoA ligase FadD1 [Gordonia sp. 4N]UPG67437.1 fatty-acid--CoA ligase FadD1 [Gordonia hongkongensis]SCC39173.1 fatty-acyl-CoA synthase [Gordonia sp. v-85]
MAETVTQLLQARADDDNLAITYEGRQWTWREYIRDAERAASAILGIADTERPLHVGVLLGNTPDMLIALAAGALGGYVTAGINNTRRGEGLAADIVRADCQILLTDAEHRPLLDGLELPGVTVLDTSTPQWAEMLSGAAELTPHSVPGAMDTFMLIFTSGTSGNPKPVQFAHMMMPFAGPVLADKYDIGPGDVCYLSMPLFHSAALMGGYCVALCGGAAIAPAKFSASTFLADIRRYNATYMNYVGKPLAYILATEERPDDADNPLRVAFGNEATDRDIDDFSRRFGCTVWDGFGSTELAIIITREPGTPHGSIGKGFPNVAVYNSSTLTECPRAEFDSSGALINADDAIGELVNIEGGGMFMGYYNDSDATSERLRHGMYWSGDLAYKDADDWIYLAGRTGDWMRVDGENLAAGPIERVLLRVPEINRVAVYAVPDDHVGDAVMAAVVLQDGVELTPESFAEQLAAQADLSPKAWPTYVRIEDDLPTTATNKILKRTLKSEGAVPGTGTLWVREPRSRVYRQAVAAQA